MSLTTPGLYHVTAIAGDPQRNAEFYVGTLGLRFVKRTVNHDDPGTYHFYFGDRKGTPGTTITFFPWSTGGRQGRFGAGQTQTTAYLIRPEAVDDWTDRLESEGVDIEQTTRLGETVLGFSDPDGIGLELVASPTANTTAEPWAESPIPEDHQLRGFHSITLAVSEFSLTASVLTDILGFELETDTDGRRRYRAKGSGPGSIVDLVETDADRGQMGVGTVHHVAFKPTDVEEQERWRERFADHGLDVTDIIDREYFQSIYAREPGGVLFEVVTMEPGFMVDEDVDELGSTLTLPEWLKDERKETEEQLLEFDDPTV